MSRTRDRIHRGARRARRGFCSLLRALCVVRGGINVRPGLCDRPAGCLPAGTRWGESAGLERKWPEISSGRGLTTVRTPGTVPVVGQTPSSLLVAPGLLAAAQGLFLIPAG